MMQRPMQDLRLTNFMDDHPLFIIFAVGIVCFVSGYFAGVFLTLDSNDYIANRRKIMMNYRYLKTGPKKSEVDPLNVEAKADCHDVQC
jgi:hypothetical protein